MSNTTKEVLVSAQYTGKKYSGFMDTTFTIPTKLTASVIDAIKESIAQRVHTQVPDEYPDDIGVVILNVIDLEEE